MHRSPAIAPPLLIGPRYFRGHGLGNDYLVVDAQPAGPEPPGQPAMSTQAGAPDSRAGWSLTPEAVRRLCARGAGVGSDGIVVLLDEAPEDGAPFPLRMFNPDGSEFERSGNGLRVLGAALHARGRVGADPFEVMSGGEVIRMRVHGASRGGIRDLSVAMGAAQAGADAAEAVGWQAEEASSAGPGAPNRAAPTEGSPPATRFSGFALDVPQVGRVHLVPVWVGNPHAVVFLDAENPDLFGEEGPAGVDLDGPLLSKVGAFLATHPAFARGTNVQLARVQGGAPGPGPGGPGEAGEPGEPGRPGRPGDRGRDVAIGIWERGVGRTPASGTSACAVAVAAVATGRRAPGTVRVRMAGGDLQVIVTPELEVVLRGPVQEVSTGTLAPGFMDWLAGDGENLASGIPHPTGEPAPARSGVRSGPAA